MHCRVRSLSSRCCIKGIPPGSPCCHPSDLGHDTPHHVDSPFIPKRDDTRRSACFSFIPELCDTSCSSSFSLAQNQCSTSFLFVQKQCNNASCASSSSFVQKQCRDGAQVLAFGTTLSSSFTRHCAHPRPIPSHQILYPYLNSRISCSCSQPKEGPSDESPMSLHSHACASSAA
jgi:hypothetical protein